MSIIESTSKVNDALDEFSSCSDDIEALPDDGVPIGGKNQGECWGFWTSRLADGKKFVGVEPLDSVGAGLQSIGEDRAAVSSDRGKSNDGMYEIPFVPELDDVGLTDDMSTSVRSKLVYNTEKVHRDVFWVLSRRLSTPSGDKSSGRTNSSASRHFFQGCRNQRKHRFRSTRWFCREEIRLRSHKIKLGNTREEGEKGFLRTEDKCKSKRPKARVKR